MQSRNPAFARSAGFNGKGTTAQTDPSQWQIDLNGGGPPKSLTEQRMTIDTVVEKTAITLGLLIVSAGAAWIFVGDVTDANIGKAYGLALGGALIGFVLSLVNSFKKVVSPPLVLAYAVVEGVFVGAFSKVIVAQFAENDPSIVFGAVLGTMAAFGGTLAAYKFFDIQVTPRFRKVVVASMFGFIAVGFLDMILGFFGASFGFNGFGPMGLLSSGIAVVIAVFMLIMDFDYVERGVAAGLPESESWRAAFGLTVTIVWLYIEILRILAILRGND
jgi:uncharacterized YccA/Bax inhibitor family protein